MTPRFPLHLIRWKKGSALISATLRLALQTADVSLVIGREATLRQRTDLQRGGPRPLGEGEGGGRGGGREMLNISALPVRQFASFAFSCVTGTSSAAH